jgi:hypothetical protein
VAFHIVFHLPYFSIRQYTHIDPVAGATVLVSDSSCGTGIGSRDRLIDWHTGFFRGKLDAMGSVALHWPDDKYVDIGILDSEAPHKPRAGIVIQKDYH